MDSRGECCSHTLCSTCTNTVICTNTIFLQSRSAATRKLLEELGSGAVFIPSANDSNIMAGQGTTAVEFLEQVHVCVFVCNHLATKVQ